MTMHEDEFDDEDTITDLENNLMTLQAEFARLAGESPSYRYDPDASVAPSWSRPLVALNRQIDICEKIIAAFRILERRDWFVSVDQAAKAALDKEIKELQADLHLFSQRREEMIAKLGYIKAEDNSAYVLV